MWYFVSDDGTDSLKDLCADDSVVLAVNEPVLMDGNTAHEVLPYSGERYSIVFYTTEDYGLVDDRDSKDVASRGLPKPTLGNHAAPHQC